MVQFPVLDGGSQRRITEVQLLSWATGRLGAAGTPAGEKLGSNAISSELGIYAKAENHLGHDLAVTSYVSCDFVHQMVHLS